MKYVIAADKNKLTMKELKDVAWNLSLQGLRFKGLNAPEGSLIAGFVEKETDIEEVFDLIYEAGEEIKNGPRSRMRVYGKYYSVTRLRNKGFTIIWVETLG